jgi:hypothetical protein
MEGMEGVRRTLYVVFLSQWFGQKNRTVAVGPIVMEKQLRISYQERQQTGPGLTLF